jgi:GNAT superfamily N-acetyltransferase
VSSGRCVNAIVRAAVPPPSLLPFADEHLDAAAALLAERHVRHRDAEPLLPVIDDFRAQIEAEWRSDGATGAAAVVDGRLVGYLIGHMRDDSVGVAAWVGLAGHATREPELVRDLYAAAAPGWLEAGAARHFALVPALDDLIDPWFRLSFGASAMQATRETAVEDVHDAGVTVRSSNPDDLEASARFDRLLGQHLAAPPSYGGLPVPDLQAYLDDWRSTWDEPEFTHFVAERNGAVVGHLLMYRRPAGDLRVPSDSIDLANAATLPDVRRSGVGLALTAHALSWAHEHGYPTMITDWRMTNLPASRFWPRRGFRPTFMRLYRSIP